MSRADHGAQVEAMTCHDLTELTTESLPGATGGQALMQATGRNRLGMPFPRRCCSCSRRALTAPALIAAVYAAAMAALRAQRGLGL